MPSVRTGKSWPTHTPRIAFPDKAGSVFQELIAAMPRAGDTLRASKPDAVGLSAIHDGGELLRRVRASALGLDPSR